MQLVLCALTGLGNEVLRTLGESGIFPDMLMTRKESGPYPYFPVPFIGDVAEEMGVAWSSDLSNERLLSVRNGGLFLVATYHRILRREIWQNFSAAINLHPSLLPKNRGPNPFYWAIQMGDELTGVTAHRLTEGVDDGAICLQRSVLIDPDHETQSTLRHRLGGVAGMMAVEIVDQFRRGKLRFEEQDSLLATSYPRISETDREIDPTGTARQIVRQVNALREWPLAVFQARRVRRIAEIRAPSAVPVGEILSEHSVGCTVRVADADLVFDFLP